MEFKAVYLFHIIVMFIIIHRATALSKFLKERTQLNFSQIVENDNFKYEEHTVTTEDGYILTIYRLMPPKYCNGKVRTPPVFLMHGLLLAADAWVVVGRKNGLAYLISELCFDLWIGNARGNIYSRKHIKLDPNKDLEFWAYSHTELGAYDHPAAIDYVLDKTNSSKLNFVGYSQGAGTFYVMCSEKPEYCNKINIMISIAPSTRQLNTGSSLVRLAGDVISVAGDLLKETGIVEIANRGSLVQIFLATFCQYAPLICDIGKDLVDADHTLHPGFVDKRTIEVLFKTFPAGTSLQNLLHYSQLLLSEEFAKFDYGDSKNLELYGSTDAPPYDLSAVTAPVVIIYGSNDGLVNTKDVLWLSEKLPNVLEMFEVNDSRWTHLDVIYSRYVKKLLFPKVRQYLLEYSNK